MKKYVENDDYQSSPVCESCDYPTHRSCTRCGRRICRGCATNHKRGNNSDPWELWKPCVPQRKKPNSVLYGIDKHRK